MTDLSSGNIFKIVSTIPGPDMISNDHAMIVYTRVALSQNSLSSGEYNYADLQAEGYSYRTHTSYETFNGSQCVTYDVDLFKNGVKVLDSWIKYRVWPQFRLIYLEAFHPEFPKPLSESEKVGRGRALMKQLLGSQEYAGFDVYTFASPLLIKSLEKAVELKPLSKNAPGLLDRKKNEINYRLRLGRASVSFSDQVARSTMIFNLPVSNGSPRLVVQEGDKAMGAESHAAQEGPPGFEEIFRNEAALILETVNPRDNNAKVQIIYLGQTVYFFINGIYSGTVSLRSQEEANSSKVDELTFEQFYPLDNFPNKKGKGFGNIAVAALAKIAVIYKMKISNGWTRNKTLIKAYERFLPIETITVNKEGWYNFGTVPTRRCTDNGRAISNLSKQYKGTFEHRHPRFPTRSDNKIKGCQKSFCFNQG